jgi:hypothetical protein
MSGTYLPLGKDKVHPRTEYEGLTGGVIEVYLYSFFNPGTRWGWVVNAMPQPLYPWERDLVAVVQEAGRDAGLVWMGVENLIPTGIRSLDCLGRSMLLYQLRYSSQHLCIITS